MDCDDQCSTSLLSFLVVSVGPQLDIHQAPQARVGHAKCPDPFGSPNLAALQLPPLCPVQVSDKYDALAEFYDYNVKHPKLHKKGLSVLKVIKMGNLKHLDYFFHNIPKKFRSTSTKKCALYHQIFNDRFWLHLLWMVFPRLKSDPLNHQGKKLRKKIQEKKRNLVLTCPGERNERTERVDSERFTCCDDHKDQRFFLEGGTGVDWNLLRIQLDRIFTSTSIETFGNISGKNPMFIHFHFQMLPERY